MVDFFTGFTRGPIPAIPLCAGIYLFFKGFKELRIYRSMEDTPVVQVAGLAMGRVEICGEARGDVEVESPVAHMHCFWYKVKIERLNHDSKGRTYWAQVAIDINGVPFDLVDATGKVRVNLKGADLDLTEFGVEMRSSDEYIERAIAGTAALKLVGDTGTPSGEHHAGGLEEARRKRHLAWQEQQRSKGGILSRVRGWTKGGARGLYRLTEYCVIFGQTYHISGTCVENPKPLDDNDRNLICKGDSDALFHISRRMEAEDQKSYRDRALWYIFGGAALAVASMGLVLVCFDLF
jgi:hypothetical protein